MSNNNRKDTMGIIEKNEEKEKYISFYINIFILFSVFLLLISIIIYLKVFSDFSAVIAVFRDKSKALYFIIFSVFNYFSAQVIAQLTSKMRLWVKILINILFAIMFTLLGCIVVIRDDIVWDIKNPFIYLIPVMSVCYLTLFILNLIKKVNKRKLFIATIIVGYMTIAISIWVGISYLH